MMNIQKELSKEGINYKGNDAGVIDTTTEHFRLIRETVRDLCKDKTYNHKIGSYTLKHLVENHLEKLTNGKINHVFNGELIKAMELEGFDWKQMGSTSLNAWFNVSQKSIVEKFKDV